MWIWYVAKSNGGNVASIISTARNYGVSTLIIKAGDGDNAWSQFSPQLVAALHAGGFQVCAWQYIYGDHPIYEAWVGAAAVRAGADCLMIDAESEYEGKYVQAQAYLKELRRLVGSSFPVGLAGFPFVDYHPGFPYSVFLGPGGAQYEVPQMYWPDIGASVSDVYAHTYEGGELYQRPIEPLGEVVGAPPPAEVLLFRQMSRAYAASLVSWWDWQGSSPLEWRALSQPFSDLQGFTPAWTAPLLSVASAGGIWAGDLVVWAQEHLLEAGQAVQVDGDFGSQTQTAVQQFQAAHGLPVTGVVDQTTWGTLLRYPRPSVVWTTQQGTTTASPVAATAPGTSGPSKASSASRDTGALKAARSSRAAMHLPVPWSASLPARGYEIPKDLGAGRRSG
jgi:hypothetical protein